MARNSRSATALDASGEACLRLLNCLRQRLWRNTNLVGAAEGCDLFRLIDK
jgi:hypothetical protein